MSYSGLFRLIKEKKIIIAECSGKQKAAISHLVTVRETIDAPRDSINNLLTLLWKKSNIQSKMIICGPNNRTSLDANLEGSCCTQFFIFKSGIVSQSVKSN